MNYEYQKHCVGDNISNKEFLFCLQFSEGATLSRALTNKQKS